MENFQSKWKVEWSGHFPLLSGLSTLSGKKFRTLLVSRDRRNTQRRNTQQAVAVLRAPQHATHFSEKPPQRIFHPATRNVAVLRRCGFHIYNLHLLQYFIDN